MIATAVVAAILSTSTAAAVAALVTTSTLSIVAAALLLLLALRLRIALPLRVALLLIAMPLLIAWLLLLLRRALRRAFSWRGRGEFAVERRGRAWPTILRRFGRETFARRRVRLVWDRWRGGRIATVIAAASTPAALAARCIACHFGACVVDRGVDRVGGSVVRTFVVRSVVAGLVGRVAHGVRSCDASCAISASMASCGFAL
jgi:hypothetical protein